MQTVAGKYIGYLILLNALLGVCLVLFRDRIFQGAEPFVGVMVGLTLLVLYEVAVVLLTGKEKSTVLPTRSVQLFMALKVAKILLSLLFILVYAVAVKVELARFMVVFGALYIIYLLFDTAYLLEKEKMEKEKLKNKAG
jgi:hypothetical protein